MNNVIDQSIEKVREIGLDNAKDSKLYFIGFSAGGVMSHRMACTYSNRISGIASVSGVLTYHGKQSIDRSLFLRSAITSRSLAQKVI